MKNNILQDPQSILDLIAKRDLDDDGKFLENLSQSRFLSSFHSRKTTTH